MIQIKYMENILIAKTQRAFFLKKCLHIEKFQGIL